MVFQILKGFPLSQVISFFFFFNTYLYLREREREREQVREGYRERETESEAGSRLQAVSTEPHAGLELTSRAVRS